MSQFNEHEELFQMTYRNAEGVEVFCVTLLLDSRRIQSDPECMEKALRDWMESWSRKGLQYIRTNGA